MSSGKIEKTPFIPLETEKSIEERMKEHNFLYQRIFFKKLKEMFLEIVNYANKREFITKTNVLIASLLNRESQTLPDSYGRAHEMPFNKSPLDSRIVLAKEIEPNHKEVKNLSLKMEFFF